MFYQYRACRRDAATIYDIENIRHGVVYARTPLQMNDPFDSMVGFSAEKIYDECIDLALDQATDSVDEKSLQQIQTLCNQEFTSGTKIRLMPDVHAGAGCTIGTTMTIKDKIVPNLVGVDIGCGMETLCIKADSEVSKNFNGAELDKIIRKNIPSGFNIRKFPHGFVEQVDWDKIKGHYNKKRAWLSLGTLGGGNHFIEADRDDEGNLYIVVHSGSRHAGLEIANYYQELAWRQLNGNCESDCKQLIEQLKAEGRTQEIQEKLAELKAQVVTNIPKDLAYLSGEFFDDYINDMKIMQHFALLNRKAMIQVICIGLHVKEEDIIEQFTTIHNYIDTDNMILRKGAVILLILGAAVIAIGADLLVDNGTLIAQ